MRLQAQQRVVRAACGGYIRQQREFGVVADGFCLVGCGIGLRVLSRSRWGKACRLCYFRRLAKAPGTTGSPCRVGRQGNRTRRAQGQLRKTLALAVELLSAQEQRLRRQGRSLRIPCQQAVALACVLPEALKRCLQVVMQHHRAVDGQVIEHRRRLVKEQRQVVLDAGRGNAGPHVLVDAAARRIALQQFAPVLAEAGTRRIVHRKLASRQQAHLRHGVEAALRVRIEGADAVDLVVEQVDAVGLRCTHGEQVDQAATHGIFARAHHLAHMRIAGHGELALEGCFVQRLPGAEMEGVACQKGRRPQPVQRRGGRNQHHIGTILGPMLADAPQRRQPLADQVLVRREAVVGQGFPVGKQHAAQARFEEGQLVQQALRIAGVGRDDGRAAACLLVARRQLRQQGGIGRGDGAGQGIALAGSELGQLHGRISRDKTPIPAAWAGRGGDKAL